MAEKAWVPRPGEVIALDPDTETKGSEQSGGRRYLVLSGQGFNDTVGLLTCLPLTTRLKGYPGEVAISAITANGKATVALAFQVLTVDWRARKAATYSYEATKSEMQEVRDFLKAHLRLS